MEISYKLPIKCGWGLMNLSNSYPDLFVYKILQWFMEHILLNIIVKFIFLLLFFLYIKNGEKKWKKENKGKKFPEKNWKKNQWGCNFN